MRELIQLATRVYASSAHDKPNAAHRLKIIIEYFVLVFGNLIISTNRGVTEL